MFYFMYVVCICIHHLHAGTSRGQKRVYDLLELELQAFLRLNMSSGNQTQCPLLISPDSIFLLMSHEKQTSLLFVTVIK